MEDQNHAQETQTEEQPSESNHDKMLSRLKFKPLKDTLVLLICCAIIVCISLTTFLLKPKGTDSHVEIRYMSTLLWDKNDAGKSTSISFPDSGEKRIQFLKSDGPLYLGDGKEFDFIGDDSVGITFTLYSDHSIQLKQDDVACPDHDCSRMGRIYDTSIPIVCLPNHIQAVIVADEGFPGFDA